MDLSLSPADLKFQKKCATGSPPTSIMNLRAKMALSKNGYVDKDSQVAWQKKLASGLDRAELAEGTWRPA